MNPNQLFKEFNEAISLGNVNTARRIRDKVWYLYENGNGQLYEVWRLMEREFVRFRNKNNHTSISY